MKKLILLAVVVAGATAAWAQATIWDVYCVNEQGVVFSSNDKDQGLKWGQSHVLNTAHSTRVQKRQ
ncbi:hypothetical protein BJN34_14340 [Cupriavidus necator]|uniref:Uncharacterized protein n=1 Tax=Cupriavidus necator TaxID=106590 RepID=A0A1U9URJ6_CUPNE|nr:hypothetical protein [Cupriavidus necator]AQV95057.1 hypothetical protein BJN34_14340 [Cupriavidus necator]